MRPHKILIICLILLLSYFQPIKELTTESSDFLNETKEKNTFGSRGENSNLIFKNAEKIEIFDSLSCDIKDYEYYSSKLSKMFERQNSSFTEYFTVRGKLETGLKSENHFNADFLDESLQSYKLILYDEMNCSEYIFSTYEGLKFLMYTETTEPFISYSGNETSKRFLIENENMFIYDIDNKEIISDISKEDKQIICNALDFENRILERDFIAHNWMDAYVDLIEHGYLPEHIIKIILTDIDFDGIPELF